jgi:uncharacterized protein (TIGR02246 family)
MPEERKSRVIHQTATSMDWEDPAERAVRALFEELVLAWDGGDGHRYASLFTDDATYVAIDGSAYRGRQEIARGHQEIFDTFFKDSRLHGKVHDVRFVRPDVAIAVRTGSVQQSGEPKPIRDETVQTFVVVETSHGWRFAAFQNTTVEAREGSRS